MDLNSSALEKFNFYSNHE